MKPNAVTPLVPRPTKRPRAQFHPDEMDAPKDAPTVAWLVTIP